MLMNIVGTLMAGVNEDGKAELYTIEPAGGVYLVKEYDVKENSAQKDTMKLIEDLKKMKILVADKT